jgi:dinuclear metal center YbgI/SA1388 family protein
MSVSLANVVEYLDEYLKVRDVPDEPGALNGLQVENAGEVSRLVAAVDACQATIDAAALESSSLLLVHHGLFWGGVKPVTDRRWKRLRSLISADVAVYSAHIPLDVHPEVGNNAVLARELGIANLEHFGDYRGTSLGFAGDLKCGRDELRDRLGQLLGSPPHVIAAGPEEVARVGVITGGAGSMIGQALEAGLDAFITGEGAHHTHFDAEEGGINVLYGGHYATETFGVRALAAHLEERFGLPWVFVNHPTGL